MRLDIHAPAPGSNTGDEHIGRVIAELEDLIADGWSILGPDTASPEDADLVAMFLELVGSGCPTGEQLANIKASLSPEQRERLDGLVADLNQVVARVCQQVQGVIGIPSGASEPAEPPLTETELALKQSEDLARAKKSVPRSGALKYREVTAFFRALGCKIVKGNGTSHEEVYCPRLDVKIYSFSFGSANNGMIHLHAIFRDLILREEGRASFFTANEIIQAAKQAKL